MTLATALMCVVLRAAPPHLGDEPLLAYIGRCARDSSRWLWEDLTIEQARAALIISAHTPAGAKPPREIHELLTQSPKPTDRFGVYRVGPWTLDLHRRRFNLTLYGPRMYYGKWGWFERDHTRKWIAKVTGSAMT